MTERFKRVKTHECVSELRQCAVCQVEQAVENKFKYLKDKWKTSLSILEGKTCNKEKYSYGTKVLLFNKKKETEIKYKNYLHSTAQLAKDDIDIKVESLKSELDTLRDSMFNNVDETVGQLEE